ncbi:unnamed protein product [Calicophoron daubneyi]|uniref:Down syndrome cell adhesion molecule n=1 Tax=Calicophoron daubneyi TaxID=300641 RepID=A0AAV2T3G1_CALDB
MNQKFLNRSHSSRQLKPEWEYALLSTHSFVRPWFPNPGDGHRPIDLDPNLDNQTRPLRRQKRRSDLHSPPRILPDLPNLLQFFDRTGLQVRCRAAGNPPPKIRWFSLPTNGLSSPSSGVGPDRPGSSSGGGSDTSVSKSASSQASNKLLDIQMDDNNYISELGYSTHVREAPQADQAVPVEIVQNPSSSGSSAMGSFEKTKTNNQVVVGDGWLNFTATHSSTMRMVFFCQADNYLGRVRSRKMVVHQVPMPDENLRIIYTTFPIEPTQKAVVSCQPEQWIFNRFLKVKYWEVYLNGSLISTVDHSFGRFSMINVTKHPELHIRSVTEAELAGLEVRCILQSIVDETVKVERPERGRLQRLQFGFSYTELRSVGSEVNVIRGSTVELPWAVEGEVRVGVDWFYLNDGSRIRKAIALESSSSGSDSGSTESRGPAHSDRILPWGTKYELVDGNLRLINLSVADSGHYIAESTHAARSLRVKYIVRVRAPLGAKITPSQRTVDWGSRVELTCEVTGHPRQLVYWLHNARLVPRRHHVRPVQTSAPDKKDARTTIPPDSLAERLIIEAFTLEDVGVYQCIVENGHSVERLGLGVSGPITHDTFFLLRTNAGLKNEANLDHPTKTTIKPSDRVAVANELAAQSTSTSGLTSGEGVGDLIDNAQDTALLTMGKMRPSLMWQNPAVEADSNAAQVLLSVHTGATDVTLECRFAANPAPNIIWYRDDQPVPLDDSGVISPEVSSDKEIAYTTITRLTINVRKVPNLDDLWTFGGEYRAVAKNKYGHADCRTYVLLETPLRIRPMNFTKPAIAGRAYTIKCYFIGSGIPTLQWHRIKNPREVQRIPVDHRHQLLEDGRVLRISEVNQEEDEADYRCTATHGDMSANITVHLKVSHAPRLFDLPQTRQVNHARDTLAYSCALQNRADKPWYAWWEFQLEGTNSIVPLPPFKKDTYNGFSVSYVDDAASRNEETSWRLPDSLRDKVPSFVHSEPNSAVHVNVNELRKELHHGNLTCVVLNEVGEDRQSIRVTFIPELEFAIRPPNNQDVTLGQTISIDCAAKPSDLQPVVEWKYLQKTTGSYISVSELSEATNGRIAQRQNGTLLVSNVDESDPREFLCFLKPGRLSTAAQRSSAVNLEVHVPARIDPMENVEKVRGSRFNLTCSVHGDSDDLKAAWYYRLSPNSQWQLIDKPCVVPVALMEDVNLDPLRLDETALAEGRTLLSQNDRLNLASSKSELPISSLEDCQSYATEGLESGVLFRQASFFKPNKRGLDKQLQFYSVKEIHMGEYLCRASNLYNRNSFGERTEAEASVRLTVISVPDPVSFVHNSSRTTATTVSFAWLPPNRDGNKPIRKYRIRYTHSEPSAGELAGAQQPNTTEVDVNAELRRIELDNLRPYTKYHITVAAINDVGPSAENALALTTQEAKPGGPVRQLIANGTASDTIVVSWDNPAPEHLNGNVDRYWVCRQRVNASMTLAELARLPWPEESSDGHLSTSVSSVRGRYGQIWCAKIVRQKDYEITGLPKFTAYAFRVIALNSKGASPPAYTQARTLEDLPQAPPADVTCTSQQHSIAVSWNPPHPDTINGILTEYHVSYFAANVYGDETSSVNQAVKGQTTVTLAGLLAYTNYTIQVAVSNRKGRGPASQRMICQTKEAPPAAPGRVKAKPLNATCIIVSWSHPRKPQGQTRNYCLEAIPLVEAPQDGVINLFTYPVPFNDRTKARCVPPDFSSSYNYYSYCGLVEQRPYNVSVRATNQFDGHKAWTGPVRPVADPPLSIVSIGGKINAQNKMRVYMDCLVIGGYRPRWTYPRDLLTGIHAYENGSLFIESASLEHSGRYECSALSDSIVYELTVQEPPKKPIWHKFTPSLRGIQAEWLSPGSRRLDAPILWFHLNWTNLFTGVSETVRLPADQRSYYLSNLTCATTVRFQLRAENKVGNSSFTDVTSWTTLGSAPLAANAAELIPNQLRHQKTVSFNLSSFLPGNGCPPLFYRLLIAPSEDGHFGLKQAVINQTLTRADLITLEGLGRERCCYNVTSLNSGAHYHYKVVATNAAGSANVQGQFWTRTVFGHEPVLRQTHQVGHASLLQQPTVIVPITALFAIILVVMIALPFFCRHRHLEESLRPSKEVTQCRNDLRPGDHPADETGQHQRLLHHPYLPYQANRSGPRSGHETLPATPGQPDSQSSTVMVSGRRDTGRSVMSNWFAGTRARLYDRGHGAADKTDHNNSGANHIEEDRQSHGSVDSEGNISPYAIYEPTGLPEPGEFVENAPATGANPKPRTTDATDGGAGGGVNRLMSRSGGREVPYGRAPVDARMGTAWNTAFRRAPNLQGGPDTMVSVPGHHYHYPNLDGVGSSTLGPPRMFPMETAGRLRATQAFVDPRLLTPSAAALIDPMLAPYDNSTLGADADLDDEFGPISSVMRQTQPGLRRRVNSFESLHRLPRGYIVSPTYNRGFGAGIPGRPSLIPPGFLIPNGASALPPGQLAGIGPSATFYEPAVGIKQSDPAVAYRGSVLSSTTVSSNHDELMQAYEYGRKHQQLRPGMTASSNVTQSQLLQVGAPFASGAHMISTADRTPTVGHPTLVAQPTGAGLVVEAEVSGGSGSSEATDSGIRQFTQQPPRPDEARHAACEVPIIHEDGRMNALGAVSRQGIRGQFGPGVIGPGGIPRTVGTSGRRFGGNLVQGGIECPSDMTDTYASVDYNGTPYGPGSGVNQRTAQQRGLYGAALANAGVVPISMRTRQPLPALPSSSTLGYIGNESSSYAPVQPSQGLYYPDSAAFNAIPSGSGQLTSRAGQIRHRGQSLDASGPGKADPRYISAARSHLPLPADKLIGRPSGPPIPEGSNGVPSTSDYNNP